MTVSPWRFEALSDHRALAELHAEWEALHARVPGAHFHQHPVWFAAWLDHLCDDPAASRVLTLRHGGTLVGVWPLTLSRIGRWLPLSERAGLCNSHMTHADLLVDPSCADAGPRMLAHLTQDRPRWDRLRIPRLREDAQLETALRLAMPEQVTRTPAEASAWLDCRVSFDEIWRGASANHRSKVTRGWHKARQIGPVAYRTAADPDTIGSALDTFIAIEASGWKGRAGTAIGQSARLRAFYGQLAREFSRLGLCEIDLLYLGDRPVAGILWFRSGQRLHLQKIGYDESLSKLGAGNLVMHEAISRACADPTLKAISFITRCPWADGWRTALAPVHEVAVYHPGWRGRLLRTVVLAKQRWRRRAISSQGSADATGTDHD